MPWLLGLAALFLLFRGRTNPGAVISADDSNTVVIPGENGLPPTKVTPTLTYLKRDSIVAALKQELGSFLYSDDEKIWNLLKDLNQGDFLEVYKAFGTMKADYLGSGESSFLGKDLNLVEWIRKEVSNPELGLIEKRFPNVF